MGDTGETGDKSLHRGHRENKGHREHGGHRELRGHKGYRGQLVRLWSVYVIFVKMFGSKIRTLFFLLII